jgi:hypothetical protein
MDAETPVQNRVNEAVDRLSHEFVGRCSSETVRGLVMASFESYRESRIADFVPLLVYKSARDQLGALVRSGNETEPVELTH